MTDRSWIAYRGDARLRDEALAQMAAHLDTGFDDITVRGHTISLYGWSRSHPRDCKGAASALGLPESLLRLGCWLYEDFPEDAASTRAQIAAFMEMLRAFRVGADLSLAGGFFCHALLTAQPWGIQPFCLSEESACLRAEISAHLQNELTGQGLDAFAPRIQRTLDDARAEVGRQWQAQHSVKTEAYETVRALEALHAVSKLGQIRDAPEALVEAGYSSIYGANGVNINAPETRLAFLRETFVEVVS